MKKLLWFVVLMWLLCWIFAPTSRADTTTSAQLKNVAPLKNNLVESALKSADEWWASKGLRTCPATLYAYDEPGAAALARADVPGCKIYMDRTYLRTIKIDLNTEYRNIHKTALRQLWCVMVHERGHNLGFPHLNDGIMIGDDDIVDHCPTENWSTKMSKLTKSKTSKDGEGKATLRHNERLQRFERTSGAHETRHQHHAPGSRNPKKSGR